MLGQQYVGFDMGENAVKIAVVSNKQVKKAIYAELPDNIVRDGVIVSMDAMADFLKETSKKAGIPAGNAAFVIPEPKVVVRNVTIPVMTDSQLKYNLPFEFKDYLSEEKSNYFYDYAVQEMENDEDGNPEKMELLACAVLKATINDYRNMFKRAGFRLKKAVPSVYAIERYIACETTLEEEETYAVVDIGYISTKIYFYKGDRVISNRTIEIGLSSLVERISEEKRVDIHIARKYLESNFERIHDSDSAKEEFNNMALEIMKVVNFFRYNNQDAVVTEIHLAGGGARIEGLHRTIATVMDMKVSLAGGNVTGIENPEFYLHAVGCTL